jgi:UDP-N-acetylglucosamine 2-epimerase (non-hydrolysing)
MKIMTVLGTRPEIIRLSAVIPLLDGHADHILVHTGQNYDDRLSRIFFEELGIRPPDVSLGVRAPSCGGQMAQIIERTEALFLEQRPDRLLLLGDTNSGLAAIVARRLGIPVYHMEAGNRCYDDRVPEEVNRRVIDHSSTVLMPYTGRSRQNLLAEGIPDSRIYVTGNPIKQVLDRYAPQISASQVLEECGVTARRYFLVTAHRSENVDNISRLEDMLAGLEALHSDYGFPVVYPLHPRTRSRAEAAGIGLARNGIRFLAPLGFFDFVRLEENAFCILSDSGTVQEEACILGVPNVTLRDVTERPETLECGSNILCGVEPQAITSAVRLVTGQAPAWHAPKEYLETQVAATVCRIVLGFRLPDTAETAWRQTKCVS